MNNLPSNINHFQLGILQRHLFAMPKSIAKSETGFTLLELLAVLFIIGIIVSFAGLSIGQRSSRVVLDETERLHSLIRVASEEAILQGRELAIEFSRESYQFLELNQNNQWLAVEQDTLFRERKLPPDIQMELALEGADASFDDKENLPRIFVLSSGELTPFVLNLKLNDNENYLLEGTIDGKLTLSRVGENDVDA